MRAMDEFHRAAVARTTTNILSMRARSAKRYEHAHRAASQFKPLAV
jgi:hypothetical protein